MRNRVHLSVVGAVCLLLLAAVAAPGSVSVESPVADAAMRGDVDTVAGLLREGADVNAAQGDGMTALHWAAANGDAGLMEILLYAGANLDPTTRLGGYTPLHLAAKEAQAETVGMLPQTTVAQSPPLTHSDPLSKQLLSSTSSSQEPS